MICRCDIIVLVSTEALLSNIAAGLSVASEIVVLSSRDGNLSLPCLIEAMA